MLPRIGFGTGGGIRTRTPLRAWRFERHEASVTPPRLVLPLSVRPQSALADVRSEEHTSELQSQSNLVCRLLLEKKKKKTQYNITLYSIHKSSIYSII